MRDRVRDYAVLLGVSMLLSLPNLGAPSLWDMDEGVNAQTTREMQASGTWIVPTFNYHLRTAKPVMLYWLQRASFNVFGVSEWSARLPSALAGMATVLLVYELARSMFGRSTGLFAGLILASAAQFALNVHAATPDAALLAFTVLAYLAFWAGHRDGGRSWWYTLAVADALAFLTKGPIGLALPAVVTMSYFAWNRELRRLLDWRFIPSTLIFLVIAGPWYALVATETRGEWLRVFFARENLERFMNPMDRHGGSLGYYFLIIPLMFSPWSAFLLPLFWYGVKGAKQAGAPASAGRDAAVTPPLDDSVRANRLLLCWVGAYLAFFTVAATKLPNYILPVYPAMAILCARYIVGWRDRWLPVPNWLPAASAAALALVGIGCVICMLLGARVFPGLTPWTVLALVPLAGAAAMASCLRRDHRRGAATAVAAASVIFIGLAVAFPASVIEPHKAPKELVRASGVADPGRDIRLGQFEWLLPSVVYYSGREVRTVPSEDKVVEFLADPTPGYLFVTERTWEARLAAKVSTPCRIVARHYDFLDGGDIIVVTNDDGRDGGR